MHGAFWKKAGSRRKREGACTNIADRDFVRDVHDRHARIEAEDDTFHRADEPVLRAKIGGQSDGTHAPNLQPADNAGNKLHFCPYLLMTHCMAAFSPNTLQRSL